MVDEAVKKNVWSLFLGILTLQPTLYLLTNAAIAICVLDFVAMLSV